MKTLCILFVLGMFMASVESRSITDYTGGYYSHMSCIERNRSGCSVVDCCEGLFCLHGFRFSTCVKPVKANVVYHPF